MLYSEMTPAGQARCDASEDAREARKNHLNRGATDDEIRAENAAWEARAAAEDATALQAEEDAMLQERLDEYDAVQYADCFDSYYHPE